MQPTISSASPSLTPSPESKKEDPEQIKRQITYYLHVQACATSRKARAEELMSRNIAKKWDADKKTQMVRRLMTAKQEITQSENAIDQLSHRLEQITSGA